LGWLLRWLLRLVFVIGFTAQTFSGINNSTPTPKLMRHNNAKNTTPSDGHLIALYICLSFMYFELY
jgi:hypothetical protein